MDFLKKIAKTIANADILNEEFIIIGRSNYYDELPESAIFVDADDIRPVAYYSTSNTDNVVRCESTVIVEFLGENATSMLTAFLSKRNTDFFRKSLEDIGLGLNAEIINLRDVRGSRQFDRIIMNIPCVHFMKYEKNEGSIDKFKSINISRG